MDPRLNAFSEAELKTVLAPFGDERTLPGVAYTSPQVFDWELENVWGGGWVCVGRSEDFAAQSATEVSVGGESLILVHHNDALRGFFNVCRHRGHEILARGETRTTAAMRCPYHGWVYGMDGSLHTAPKTHHRIDLDDIALVGVLVAIWHGWVFVTLDDAAPPIEAYLGSLDTLIGRYNPGALRTGATESYELAANWKLVHENYHECYHCSSIHPQLVKVSDPDSGSNYTPDGAWVGGTLDLNDGVETLSIDGRSTGRPIAGLDPDLRRNALYVGIVPNLLISCHPDYVLTHRLIATSADSTTVECRWLFPPDFVGSEQFDPAYAVDFWDVTNRQDWLACESLQRGALSRGHRPGYLSEGEDAVYQFLGKVATSYLAS